MGRTSKKAFNGKLTPQQEKFCRLYASDKEFFGNGVESYLEAYKVGKIKLKYNVARSAASRLLTNVNVLKRINELLTLEGFNDENMDKQLMLVAMQNADYRAKVSAINLYGQLKKRIGNKEEELKERPIIVNITNFDGKTKVDVKDDGAVKGSS